MVRLPTEQRFESYIENSLKSIEDNGLKYTSISHTKYDRELCLIPSEVIAFIKSSQPEEYEKLELQYGTDAESKILKRIADRISSRGVIQILRKGVEDRGAKIKLVYFEPKRSFNEEYLNQFLSNRVSIVRQLHYSLNNENSIDIVFFINGIPVITMELKNQLTGQTILDAEKQYREDRDPNEPLLKFKRCIAHFAVDNDKVSMTTRLNRDSTRFLPYNQGIENSIKKDDYKVNYLWEDTLKPTSILDILENFIVISKESDFEWSGKEKKVVEKKKEILIFPRYHQLDVIRKLREAIVREGVGNNYLIQHTTGSGKSFSIGWLSHLLVSLFQNRDDTNRIFDSVVVITDRKILDSQLQNTIKQLEQTVGVVEKIDKDSNQLLKALEKGKNIIVTTIQKFGVVVHRIAELQGNNFAVIIDEVHSSQSGEQSKNLKKVLTINEVDEVEDYEDIISREMATRGKQNNISFFGFTGTPKNKTLEIFGRKNKDGEFESFHNYTMEQSIYEGFTIDVLKHYSTYTRWFKLIQINEEDRELPEGETKKVLINFVDSSPETIKRKVKIILEQFTNHTAKKIIGKARAMVVVRSRLHCVLFNLEMKKQMKEKNLIYSSLVAFSGSITHEGRDLTENMLNQENGLKRRVSIKNGLKDPRFRILIVSNKFQTGFDEPLLHTTFIDKKLFGVQCVQTLSRLNRITKGKTDTFVLDFVNNVDLIQESFQKYYTTTILSEATDPNKLSDLKDEIEDFSIYDSNEVKSFSRIFFDERKSDETLHPILDSVVERFKELDKKKKKTFNILIRKYCKLYGYISQIISFEDKEKEELNVFLRYLDKKLPKDKSEKIDISDSIDLDSLRIQKQSEIKIKLEGTKGIVEPPSSSTKEPKEVSKDMLSKIIEEINKTYGEGIKEKHKIYIKRIYEGISSDNDLIRVLEGDNSTQNKKEKLKETFDKNNLKNIHEDMQVYKDLNKKNIKAALINMFFQNLMGRKKINL